MGHCLLFNRDSPADSLLLTLPRCCLSHPVHGSLENGIHFIQAQATRFRNEEQRVDEGKDAPSDKEQEGTPDVHTAQDARCCFCDGEIEQPVKSLGQRTTKRSNTIRLKLRTEQVW